MNPTRTTTARVQCTPRTASMPLRVFRGKGGVAANRSPHPGRRNRRSDLRASDPRHQLITLRDTRIYRPRPQDGLDPTTTQQADESRRGLKHCPSISGFQGARSPPDQPAVSTPRSRPPPPPRAFSRPVRRRGDARRDPDSVKPHRAFFRSSQSRTESEADSGDRVHLRTPDLRRPR